NLNTVALLEPIAKKISQMTVDEKTNFKLSPDFASTSKTVFLRTLKKIYGSNKGSEMINLLNTNPSQSIPVVLKRLKQKDAEWKRAQREWNKIWREVESKNYWKSLDHQGVLFKLSDRKTLTTQSFVIQAELDEQFQFGFQDKAIFKDVSRLVYFFLESQPIYTREDCLSMRRFMNTIIPAMFDVNDVEPSLMTVDDIGLEEVDDDEFDDKSSVQSLDSVLSNQQNKRRALEIQGKRTSRRNRFERVGLLKNVLMRNTTLYDRLHKMKKLDEEFEKDQRKSKQACKEALDLGITPRRFKSKRQKVYIIDIDAVNYKTALKMDTKKGYYNVLLALIDKLLEGEVDQQTFEESVRYIFGSDAYVLFTIDKLVLLLVRHIHIIITDAHSQRLFEIFKTEHRAEQMDQGDSLSYKTKVIGILDPVDN
ncbi:Transcriptional regulatory protein sin3, partial [Rhizopus stolonifer]